MFQRCQNSISFIFFFFYGVFLYFFLTPNMVTANPLYLGETQIKLRRERVDITIRKAGNDLISSTTCQSVVDIWFVNPDNLPESELPHQQVIIQFPVPSNSENIKAHVNETEFVDLIPQPLPSDYERWFPGYLLVEWKLPLFEKELHAEVQVEYIHRLPQEGTAWLLEYAFGTGNVMVKEYQVVYLRIQLPMILQPNEVKSLNELKFDHQIVGNETVLTFGEVFDFGPKTNVKLLIQPQSGISGWELY